jgi:hypothetical protein
MSNHANEEAFVDALEVPVPPDLGDDLLQAPAAANIPMADMTMGETAAAVTAAAAIAGLGIITLNLDANADGDNISQMEMPSLQGGVGTAEGERGAVASAIEVDSAIELGAQSVDICNETTIKLAKSCIYFNKAGWLGYRVKRTGVTTQFTAKPKKKTGVPRAFHWIHNPEAVPKLELKDQLKVYDSGAYRKLYIKTPRDKDQEPFFFVCKLCYADALCPLDNCLFKMVLSKGKPHGANLGKHLKNVHGFNDKGVREGESPAKRGCDDDEGTSTVAVTVSDQTRNPTPASKKAKLIPRSNPILMLTLVEFGRNWI